jgi:hypothetical protein
MAFSEEVSSTVSHGEALFFPRTVFAEHDTAEADGAMGAACLDEDEDVATNGYTYVVCFDEDEEVASFSGGTRALPFQGDGIAKKGIAKTGRAAD